MLIRFFENLVGKISIHAPREGCDPGVRDRRAAKRNFNPRTPRGVRPGDVLLIISQSHFNPRTPRGVRPSSLTRPSITNNFNPRTPRGVRLENSPLYQNRVYFNPRTPRGVRLQPGYECKVSDEFQSTHPARGATFECTLLFVFLVISIHAPREGCDLRPSITPAERLNFNPRTPRGVRRPRWGQRSWCSRFQSTHPARGATKQ